mgnify:CR=1 FL=1
MNYAPIIQYSKDQKRHIREFMKSTLVVMGIMIVVLGIANWFASVPNEIILLKLIAVPTVWLAWIAIQFLSPLFPGKSLAPAVLQATVYALFASVLSFCLPFGPNEALAETGNRAFMTFAGAFIGFSLAWRFLKLKGGFIDRLFGWPENQ